MAYFPSTRRDRPTDRLMDRSNNHACLYHQLHRPDIQGERNCSSLSDSTSSPARNQSPYRSRPHMRTISLVPLANFPSTRRDRSTLVPGCWRTYPQVERLDRSNNHACLYHQLHRPDIQGERHCSSLSDSTSSPARNQSPCRNLLHMQPISFVLMAYF